MPFRGSLFCFLAGPLAAERFDTWVLKASIAVALVLIAGLALWHLAGYLRPKRRRAARLSPEPPEADRPPRARATGRGPAEGVSVADDPQRLRESCAAQEEALADLYLALAECCLRHGQPDEAAAALQKVLRICPGRRQAQAAQERLHHLGRGAGPST